MRLDMDQLVTSAEAAEIAGRTADAMKRAMYRGRLSGRKVGGSWVTTRRDLAIYIAETDRRSRRGPWR